MKRRAFPKGTGERVSITTRTTVRVRDGLEEAARASGRSVSQEIERRLAETLIADDVIERAFDLVRSRDQTVVDMLGGPQTFSLLQDISFLIKGIQSSEKTPWHESPEIRAKMFKVISSALGDILRRPRSESVSDDDLGRVLDLVKYLPDQPRPERPAMPEGARFMTDDELKEFFYLNDDNK